MSAGGTTMARPTTPQPAPGPARTWRCLHCGKVLGQIANGVLHERECDKSGFPVVRRCGGCGKRNVKFAA